MKHGMDSPHIRDFKVVCFNPNILQNFIRATKLSLTLMLNAHQSQILGAQQYQIPDEKLYVAVVFVVVALLYHYTLFHMPLCLTPDLLCPVQKF